MRGGNHGPGKLSVPPEGTHSRRGRRGGVFTETGLGVWEGHLPRGPVATLVVHYPVPDD